VVKAAAASAAAVEAVVLEAWTPAELEAAVQEVSTPVAVEAVVLEALMAAPARAARVGRRAAAWSIAAHRKKLDPMPARR
jgi:hypothetical protein